MILPFLARPVIGSLTPPVVPGSANYTSVGTFSFIVPYHNTLSIDVRGPGGGGGGSYHPAIGYSPPGGNGGNSVFYGPDGNVIAYGGSGGQTADFRVNQYYVAPSGAHGSASGGNTLNQTGGGAAGGAGAYQSYGGYGAQGGAGGYGGRATKTFSKGVLMPRSTITIVVGGGGAGSPVVVQGGYPGAYANGVSGGNGAIYISWS